MYFLYLSSLIFLYGIYKNIFKYNDKVKQIIYIEKYYKCPKCPK